MADTKKKDVEIPVYRKIEMELLSLLNLDEYTPHSQFLSEVELCNRFEVNPITARKAVDSLVSKGLLYKVHRSGTFVSPPSRNRLVLLVTTNTQSPKIGCLTPVAAKYPDLQWQELFIGDLRPHVSDIKHVYPKLIGALFVRDLPNCMDVVSELQRQGVPVCFCGSDIHAPFLEKTHAVLCKESDLVDLALRHLYDRGCRNLGLVGTTEWPAFLARGSAMQEWCQKARLPLKKSNLISLPLEVFNDSLACYESLKEILSKGDFDADGVFCVNDELTACFVQAALANGIKVPEQMKIVTTDDNDRITNKVFPQISAVRLPIDLDIQQGLSILSSETSAGSVYERRFSDIHLIQRQST